MRIRADEHIAPAIIVAIQQMALAKEHSLDSILAVGAQGSPDVHWITAFAAEGGEAILTADTDFLKNPPQVMAVFQTGLRVIHLPAKWANAEGRLQAAHLLLWWKRIEEQLQTMKPRECYRPAWTIQETAPLQKIDVDFHAASKKLKKSAKKAKKG